MKLYKFEATPTLQPGGQIQWQLCYLNPEPPTPAPQCGDGSQARPYPNVKVPKGDRDQPFQFEIKGDHPDIFFAPISTPTKYYPGPIWVQKKGQPNEPGVHGQIEDVQGARKKILKFVNENDNTGELVLHYQLNFIGPGEKISSIDPDITNGGKGFTDSAAAMLIAAAVLTAVLVVAVAAFVAKRVAESAIQPRAAAAGSTAKVGTQGTTPGPTDRNPQG